MKPRRGRIDRKKNYGVPSCGTHGVDRSQQGVGRFKRVLRKVLKEA